MASKEEQARRRALKTEHLRAARSSQPAPLTLVGWGDARDALVRESGELARRVLSADDQSDNGVETYNLSPEFMGISLEPMIAQPNESLPAGLYLTWAWLSDMWDEPDATSQVRTEAVRLMKAAASEWLDVVESPELWDAYFARWERMLLA